jgi:hypothetical protein
MPYPQCLGAALAVASLCLATGSLAQTAAPPKDTTAPPGGWSVNDLIGTKVRSADGREVGEVEDLIIAPDAKVATVVVSVGGFLDIADKRVGVPFGDVQRWSGSEALALPLTSAELEAAPAFGGGRPAMHAAEPLVDPERAAPPDAATRQEAEQEAERSFGGDDPRVAEGIAENTKAYEDEKEKPQPQPQPQP